LGDGEDERTGCFKVECIGSDDCPSNKACDLERNRCNNPCDSISEPCIKGVCQVVDHEPVCICNEGYILSSKNKCEDYDECTENPCHSSAICQNIPGSFICSCPQNMIGDPIQEGCRDSNECYSDADCHYSASCIESKCLNPCDYATECGNGALCKVLDHKTVCTCPSNTIGDPKVECKRYECNDDHQCSSENQCIDYKCVNPCALPSVCGQNAHCDAINHARSCSCLPGFTGNPVLGCIQIHSCRFDKQCPSGAKCHNNICSITCSSNRDCLSSELCIQNICQPSCKSNSTCGDQMFCFNNVCVREPKCLSDDDCEVDENCAEDSTGRNICKKVCDARFICGRNSECAASKHIAECQCKQGYFFDGTRCTLMECNDDSECSADKKCENFSCKNVCFSNNQCGKNSLCIADKHRAGKF
jgi:hypothetical protein